MVAKQEVASITTYIYASRLIFSIYRFEWVTSSMAPFIIYFGDSIWPPNRKEVPLITTDIDANQLFLCLCRFSYVTNSMAPFI